MKLFITGNGFDLYHGLDTSYYAFGYFLKLNNRKLYDTLVECFHFTDLPTDCGELDKSKHALWSDFESNLAEFDTESILDSFEEYAPRITSPDFSDKDWHTFSVVMQGLLEEITDGLLNEFKFFICQVKYNDLKSGQKLKLSNNDIYINFNYTNTLEYYYAIEKNKILYLHGDASLHEDMLILGHGIDPENFVESPEKPPENATDEELMQWEEYMADKYDYAFESGKNTINQYFKQSFKNTAQVISSSKEFFSYLGKVKEIIIIGHSLSEVDMPYFVAINQLVQADTTWTATFYLENEREKHRLALQRIGVKNPNIISINSI